MHIVHTEASCGWGGQEIRILTESAGMMSRGHHVTLLANAEAPIRSEAEKLGIETSALSLRKNSPGSVFGLRQWIATHRPDVINTHSSADAWAAALARTLRKLPVVRTRHISAPVPRSPLSQWLYLSGADRVVTTGTALRDTMRQQFPGHDDHFLSIPTGIDLDRYSSRNAISREAGRAQIGLPVDGRVIGIAATLRSWKGHEFLVDAFDQLAAAYPDLHLLIVGDGPQQPRLAEMIAQCTHGGRIHMPGHRADVENALVAMDIFALPSYANEGVPQAILQAMAMELPVVSTGVGAIGEALCDGETGIMIAPRDSAALRDALRILLDSPERATTLGRAGRARVEAAFSLDIMLDRMEAVFRQLTER